MRLFNILARAIDGIMGLLGRSRTENQSSTAAPIALDVAAEIPRPIMVPAVAGFQMRLHVDRFLFARRLASVAKLNTPVGRKPRTTSARAAGTPAVPTSRIGAKKLRIDHNHGPRVLRQTPPQARPSATIIPFPALRATQAGRSKPLRNAA